MSNFIAEATPQGVSVTSSRSHAGATVVQFTLDEASELMSELRAAWLVGCGKEELTLTAQSVEEGDFFEGWEIMSVFTDLEHVTLHFDNYGKLTVPSRTVLTIMRTIQ